MLDRMKTKKFVVIVVLGVFTSFFLWAINSHNSAEFAHTIVSETSKKITNLKKLNEEVSELSHVEERYMSWLGFVAAPRLYPAALLSNVSAPVLVSAVLPDHVAEVDGFVRSGTRFLPSITIVLYGIYLSSSKAKQVEATCNCTFIEFDPDGIFPRYATDDGTHSYRPLVIQKALDTFQAVIFLDVTVRVITSQVGSLIKRATPFTSGTSSEIWSRGVVAWRDREPVTALTHLKMFRYFDVDQSKFFFKHLVDSSNIIIYNTLAVHEKLMMPWVRCALTENCLSPIGAQASGCSRLRRPMYKYSGCHSYDKSAFSIILLKMAAFNESAYSAPDEARFFAAPDPLGPKLDNGNWANYTRALERRVMVDGGEHSVGNET